MNKFVTDRSVGFQGKGQWWHDIILAVKQIASRQGISKSEVCLVYMGKPLSNNNKTMEDLGIENKSTIFIVYRLTGGEWLLLLIYQFFQELQILFSMWIVKISLALSDAAFYCIVKALFQK